MGFRQHLQRAWASTGSMLCVGLDPDPARFPSSIRPAADATFAYCRDIVDATADLVCAFKPQIAYFASQGAEPQLERLCSYIRSEYPDVVLVLDAKRGDIGPTAEHYAREAFDRFCAHVVTVNPYLGTDAVAPFLQHPDGGVFVLCRTSNSGGDDFQSLVAQDDPLFIHVARRVATEWSQIGECGLVVGATYPDELRQVRDVVGDLPILVPGIGAQGGDIDATVRSGAAGDGYGMVINSSRAIMYASAGDDFADAARSAALATCDQIRAASLVRSGQRNSAD